jgi:antitoxin (DNA-binding transcriptional repressor) of toxin-antitoxin stability system
LADKSSEKSGFRGEKEMRIIDIEEVRANLEELIDELKPGESFAISVGGVPKVKVEALFPEEEPKEPVLDGE